MRSWRQDQKKSKVLLPRTLPALKQRLGVGNHGRFSGMSAIVRSVYSEAVLAAEWVKSVGEMEMRVKGIWG